MASFGHLAVGMMAGRLQRGAWKGGPGPDAAGAAPGAMSCRAAVRAIPILAFALLGLLPDIDLIVVALGAPDSAAGGHRGGSHSLLTAIALGIGAGVVAKRIGWGAVRTALAVTLAVGSHGILDAFGQGGRGIPLFWPVSEHRFMAPASWRLLPDAPRGMKFLTRSGLMEVATEFVYFLPFTIYALLPARAGPMAGARAAATAPERSGDRERQTNSGGDGGNDHERLAG
jgi:inner membrane protein